MAAIDILNLLSPIVLAQDKAAQYIETAAVFVTLYPSIPSSRIDLATVLYAGHLMSQLGILQPVVSENFDGASVSFQAYNLGDKDGASTWLQEFTKLVPDFYTMSPII